MFRTKSFNLIKEEDLKRAENSDKYGWLRCLIIPALTVFILTLILVNVDFSGQPCTKDTTTEKGELSSAVITNTETTIELEQRVRNEEEDVGILTTLLDENIAKSVDVYNDNESVDMWRDFIQTDDSETSLQPKSRFGNICNEKSDYCTVTCQVSSNDAQLSTELEKQYAKCNNDLDVTLQASTFPKSTLGRSFLVGNFKLKSLTILNCIIYTISDNAFKKPSMLNMKKLILNDLTITKLTALTFAGLGSVEHFEMSIKESLDKLNAKSFLTPMAPTLKYFRFVQSSALTQYDPENWFSGVELIKLKDVILTGNNFPVTLNAKSFTTLVSVENLSLQNCKINFFAENTFAKIMNTLCYLDLSRNSLKTLSTDFLQSISAANINISLIKNSFDCSCNNNEFVDAMQNMKINFSEEPKCSTPSRLNGIEIRKVKNCCENENEECPEETTTTTTTTTTTSTTESTVTVTVTETETETDTETETETITTSTIESTEYTPIITTKATPPDEDNEISETSTSTTTTSSSSEELFEIEVVCRNPIDHAQSIIALTDQSLTFTLHSLTPTSIAVEFQNFSEGINLLYFMSNNTESNKTMQVTTERTILDNLIARKDYLYCAIPQKIEKFSLLNCRSHHTALRIDHTETAWLKNSDMPLFFSLSIFGVLLCLIIGVIIVFFVLRWRPVLLKGSKRLLRLHNDSKQVFLSKDNTALSTEELYEALRTYSSIYSSPTLNLTNSDYLQYFHHRDTTRTIYTDINFSDNQPPVQRAPAMPPLETVRQLSSQSTIPSSDMIFLESISEVDDEHEYQSLEQYQQIYDVTPVRKRD